MNRPSYLLFKQCSKCGEILHVSRFYKVKNGKYGVEGACKECRNKHNKKYREEHKEEIKKQNKEYREEHKEEIREYNKKWFENNPKKMKEYQKKYYENHKEERREYSKRHKKNNPHIVFNQQNKRRSKEENQGRGVTKEQWYEMMEFFDWKCAYSGEKMENNKTPNGRTVDHIIPLDDGGENEPWNCIPMKKGYNTSKYTNNILEWYLEQEFFSIERLTKIYEWRVYAYWKWYKKGDE